MSLSVRQNTGGSSINLRSGHSRGRFPPRTFRLAIIIIIVIQVYFRHTDKLHNY